MLINDMNNYVSTFVFKIICGIKRNNKFNNIYRQRKMKKINLSIKHLMILKDCVRNISNQDKIQLFSIQCEWKLIN